MVKFHLGLDDTDNPEGGCTTYTATKILDELNQVDEKFQLLDFPKLIRLNPNVPYKTRGNGAVAIHAFSSLKIEEIVDLVKRIILRDTKSWKNGSLTEPSFVIADETKLKINHEIYWKALQRMLKVEDIEPYLKNYHVWSRGIKRSLIGSLAAIQSDLTEDYTFELIAYRKAEYLGKKRHLEPAKLKDLMKTYSDSTFSNFDFIENRELIAPSGPDPVFCGIRGENPEVLISLINEIPFGEPLEGYTIFKTNQGTGHHLKRPSHSWRPWEVHTGIYRLVSDPRILQGGHVSMRGRELKSARLVDLFAFEPTKSINKICQGLKKGDLLFIEGALKEKFGNLSISIEEMRIIDIAPQERLVSPLCPNCQKKTTSAGRYKGYKCKGCGYRTDKGQKINIERGADFRFAKLLSVPSAQRHLTKPYERFGKHPNIGFEPFKSKIRVRY